MTSQLFGGLSLVLLSLAGCGTPIKTSSDMLQPANSSEASRLKRVMVLRFEKLGTSDVTADVEAQLAGARVNDVPHFVVVERAKMNEALKEMRLAESGAIDASTASRLGRMVAANGVYMGAVVRDEVGDQPYTETRSKCVQFKQERDKKGNTYDGACMRWSDVPVNCIKRSATFAFSPKLVDVETATIKYANTITKTISSSRCADASVQMDGPEQHRQEARLLALQQFREDVAPYTRRVEIQFLDSSDGLTQATSKPRFEGAFAFAKGGRMDRACEIWDELSASEDKSYGLHYNRGVCAEVAGRLDDARALYVRADRLLMKPEPTISAGLARVRDAQAARAKAISQLGR